MQQNNQGNKKNNLPIFRSGNKYRENKQKSIRYNLLGVKIFIQSGNHQGNQKKKNLILILTLVRRFPRMT